MRLDNRTHYLSGDLERIVVTALHEGEAVHYRGDLVRISYGKSFNGYCYFPHATPPKGEPRMRLIVPRPLAHTLFMSDCEFREFVWLVRHEVAHWRGLAHSQMGTSLRYWRARATRKGPFGEEMPLPPGYEGLTPRVDLTPREKRAKVDRLSTVARQIEQMRANLARAERRSKSLNTRLARLETTMRRMLAARARLTDAKRSQ